MLQCMFITKALQNYVYNIYMGEGSVYIFIQVLLCLVSLVCMHERERDQESRICIIALYTHFWGVFMTSVHGPSHYFKVW